MYKIAGCSRAFYFYFLKIVYYCKGFVRVTAVIEEKTWVSIKSNNGHDISLVTMYDNIMYVIGIFQNGHTTSKPPSEWGNRKGTFRSPLLLPPPLIGTRDTVRCPFPPYTPSNPPTHGGNWRAFLCYHGYFWL